jgi:hypothetical protein
MDGQRFDEVARLFGSGASRRSVLKGLTGALIGVSGIAGHRSLASATVACAAEDEACAGGDGESTLPDCCGVLICKHAEGEEGVCVSICGGAGDPCTELLDCCAPDYFCNSETSQCQAAAADCETDEDCGEGTICCGYGGGTGNAGCVAWECCGEGDADHCDAGEACTAAGVCEVAAPECETDTDCVLQQGDDDDTAAICCAGVCRQIECCIDDVLTGGNPNDRCDAGEVCFEGQCVFVCKGDADCASGTCCCPDGTCSSSCCEGAEAPVALPSTGVGDGESGLSGVLGAGMLAAGAAYLAGKKLQPKTDD